MSQDDLHAAANADTPKEIQVPNTPWALAAWVLARFGVGGGVIMAVLYGINVVYADLKAEGQSKPQLMQQVIQLQTTSVQAIENRGKRKGGAVQPLNRKCRKGCASEPDFTHIPPIPWLPSDRKAGCAVHTKTGKTKNDIPRLPVEIRQAGSGGG